MNIDINVTLTVLVFALFFTFAIILFLNFKKSKQHHSGFCVSSELPMKSGRLDPDVLYNESESLAFSSRQLEWKTSDMIGSFSKIKEYSDSLEKSSELNLSSSEEIDSNISSFSSQNEILYESIEKISKHSDNSIKILDENKADMDELTNEIANLKNQIVLAVENNDKLKESSNKVYNIISYIDVISRQTGMLAINASIEAARVGSAGQGFAVVAKEIGKLSTQAGESVKNISEVVEGTLEDIAINVSAMEKINTAMQDMYEKLDKFLSSSNDVNAGIHEIKKDIGVILDTSKNQQMSINNIEIAMENIVKFAESTYSSALKQNEIIGEQKEKNIEIEKICDNINAVGDSIQELATKNKKQGDIIFAINPFVEPNTIREQYLPVIKSVCEKAGYNAKVLIVKNYEDLGRAVNEKVADIGWFSPLAYVDAHKKYNLTPLVTPEVGGKASYKGYIITLKESGINKINDLKGKTFAYVDPKSASGYLYAMDTIKNSGLNPDTVFAKTDFLGSHDNVIKNVLSGNYEAGATYSDAFEMAISSGLPMDRIQIIAKTPDIPKDALAYGNTLSDEEISKLLKAFTDFKLSADINSIVDGFVEANDSNYDIIRKIN